MKKIIYLIIVALFATSALFADSDTPLPNWMKTDGSVLSVESDGTYTYIGGSFHYVGPYTGYGAKLTTTIDDANVDFPMVNDGINTVVADGSGGWYIGGTFTQVGTYLRNNIAHINPDGSVDETWNPNPDASVISIAISGTDIYVAGMFSSIGGQSINYIAKLNNTNGNADPNWNPSPDEYGYIYTIGISGTDIYVAGDFTSIGGQSRNRIAKLNNSTGAADGSWNPIADSYVNALAIDGTNIYVGGNFTTIGGQTRNYLAKLNNTDGSASSWDPSPNGTINSIAIDGTNIYVGGQFNDINGGTTRTLLAKIDGTSGVVDGTWNPEIGITETEYISSIAITATDIYVGGSFNVLNSEAKYNIAKLNKTDGVADANWNPNPNSSVNAIAVSGNNLYIGGFFRFIGGYFRNYLARIINSTGQADENWNPDPNDDITVITLSGADVFVGGDFQFIGGQTRSFIAKLNNTNGDADATWNPNPDWQPHAIAVSGSDIYVGGNFETIGGESRSYIAKLNNTDGAADATWNPNASNRVYTIAISGPDIYIGGEFITVNAVTERYYVAKLNNTDGTADPSWNPGADNPVMSLAISGSDVYAAGFFYLIGGQNFSFLAKLNNTNGNANATWVPNPDNPVTAIAISGTDIYVGGYFTSIGGNNNATIAKLNNTNGNSDATWVANPDEGVTDIELSGAYLFVGGGFEVIGNEISPFFAAFQLPPTTQATEITFPTTASTSLSISWTNGDANRRAVFVKQGAGAITNPADNTTYTASTNWSAKGDQLGASGYYCVYNGIGNSVTVNNLTKNTAYYVQVFEYNGDAGSEQYLTTTATNNPNNESTDNPVISLNTTGFVSDYGNVLINTNSSERTFTVSGTDLQGNITVTAPTGFEVSLESGANFASSKSISPTNKTVNTTTIYTRFTPTLVQTYGPSNVTNASTDATTQNVAVSGNGYNIPSTQASDITISTTTSASLSISWTSGDGAKRAVFVKQGAGAITNPTNNTTYTASTNWSAKGSQSGASGYYCVYNGTDNSVTVSNLSKNTAYYIQVFEYNGNAGSEQYLTSTATNNPNNESTDNPVISLNTTGFVSDYGNVLINTNSSERTFTVSGTDLQGDITVTAPTGFEVSLESGANFATSKTISPTSKTVNSTTIYARFSPALVQSYSGNISNTSTDATTQDVSVQGSGISAPTIQASNIFFSNISRTGMTVNWTRGNGEASLLLGKESAKISATPLSDGQVYNGANSIYTSAPTVGGAKLLYNGTAANPSVSVTGLTKYKLLYFKVCEYNNVVAPIYLQTENASNPSSRWTLRRDALMEEDLSFDMEYAYPNPVSNSITTTLDLFEAGTVTAKLYDINGKLAADLYNQALPFGTHELKFDVSSVISGVYQLIISKGSDAIIYPVSVVR